MGFTTSRHEALRLFNLKRWNPEYQGASHNDIGRVFAGAAWLRQWHWEFHQRFDFAAVSKSVSSHLQENDQPTLMSFKAIHKNGIWRSTHVAVVVSVSEKVIDLLDPLSEPPRTNSNSNVRFYADGPRGRIRVSGSSYNISHHSVTAVLRWAQKEAVSPWTKTT